MRLLSEAQLRLELVLYRPILGPLPLKFLTLFFKLSPYGEFYFEYSINEKVALEVGGGAALAGIPTLVTMKHVGVNVAADP